MRFEKVGRMTECGTNTGIAEKMEPIVSVSCLAIMAVVIGGWALSVFTGSAMIVTALICGGLVLAWPVPKSEPCKPTNRHAVICMTVLGAISIIVGIAIQMG